MINTTPCLTFLLSSAKQQRQFTLQEKNVFSKKHQQKTKTIPHTHSDIFLTSRRIKFHVQSKEYSNNLFKGQALLPHTMIHFKEDIE